MASCIAFRIGYIVLIGTTIVIKTLNAANQVTSQKYVVGKGKSVFPFLI